MTLRFDLYAMVVFCKPAISHCWRLIYGHALELPRGKCIPYANCSLFTFSSVSFLDA